MSELVELVSTKPHIDPVLLPAFAGDLEQWMSFLSVDQPWLTEAENHDNRATFLRLTEYVHSEISAAEGRAVDEPPPPWLTKLAWTASDLEAAIFTFNYDTLLERALSTLRRVFTWADLYAAPLTSRSPAASQLFLGPGEPTGRIPAIFKLHGSVNWAFGGLESPPTDPIVLTADGLDWQRAHGHRSDIPPRNRHTYDDLKPLIVPPTFSKGPYFSNRALQAQWRTGAEALSSSSELVIIGYSFPTGDLVARQWISTSFKGSKVTVVNPDGSVAERVRFLLNSDIEVSQYETIDEYVATITGPILRWRVALTAHESEGVQIELHVDDRDLLASVDRKRPPWNPFDESATTWLASVLDQLAPGATERAVVANGPDGGLRESKWVVMDKGWCINEASLRHLVEPATDQRV